MKKYEAMDAYREELNQFKGDKALFWAGRMAQTIKAMTSCSPLRLSGYIELLDLLREEYDRIIFDRVK